MWGVGTSHRELWNEEELLCCGDLSGSWTTPTRSAEERSLLGPTLRSPQFWAKAWDRGFWCERPTMGLTPRLGAGGISAVVGRRESLTASSCYGFTDSQ